jgi:hypothetical protein
MNILMFTMVLLSSGVYRSTEYSRRLGHADRTLPFRQCLLGSAFGPEGRPALDHGFAFTSTAFHNWRTSDSIDSRSRHLAHSNGKSPLSPLPENVQVNEVNLPKRVAATVNKNLQFLA